MVQRIITTNVSISELKPIIEKQIRLINGKIISNENDLIQWNFKSGKNQIEVKTSVKKIHQKVEVKIISKNIENKPLGEGIAITNFLNSLSEIIDFEEKKEVQKKEQKTQSIPNYKNHSNNINYKPYLIGIVIILVLYLIGGNINDSTTSNRITQQGFKASYSEETLHNLVTYSVNKDYKAIDNLLNSGEIFELPSGQEAYIIESKFGRVKIRLKGDSNEIWTFTEAIKQ